VIIEANYFSHPHDVAVLVRAIKDSLLIGQSSHFKQFGAKFYDKPLDQCSQVLHYLLEQRLQVMNITCRTNAHRYCISLIFLLVQCFRYCILPFGAMLQGNAHYLLDQCHRYCILPFGAMFTGTAFTVPFGAILTKRYCIISIKAKLKGNAYYPFEHCFQVMHTFWSNPHTYCIRSFRPLLIDTA
jgi:hypothetical protein